MAAISSSSVGAQSAAQAGWQQLKLQQAKQNADRAEANARALASRAAEAQSVADRAQESARNLTVQSSQAQDTAGQARQGLAMIRSVGQMQASLSNTVGQVSERMDIAAPEGKTSEIKTSSVVATPTPVRNTSGQITGTMVNTTA